MTFRTIWNRLLLHPMRFGIAGQLGVAAVSLLAGVAFRWFFLSSLHERLIWLTFYPGVMVAALFGGGGAGILVIAGAWSIAFWGGALFGVDTFIRDQADRLGAMVFLLNGGLMTLVAVSSRRARLAAWEAKTRAEDADMAKSRFLASMSHEMRTPLNAIIGFSRLMGRNPGLDPESREQNSIVQRSATHLLGLINEILEHARASAGKSEVARVSFDLDALVSELTAIFKATAQEKGLNLELVGGQTPGRMVFGDPGKLRQILFNLVGNATKFTDRGWIRIELERDDAGWTEIRIRDTGLGILKEDEHLLFRPFERSSSVANVRSGTGLGLSIASAHARLMGGSLVYRRPSGQGSEFVLRIQLPDSGTRPGSPTEENALWRIEEGRKPFRVLIVDDNSANLQLLCMVLEQAGMAVSTASGGEEALARLVGSDCSIVVTDILMPGLDGVELVRRIRKEHERPEIPVIGFSASAHAEDHSRFLEAGGNLCLSKPLREVEMFAALSKLTGTRFTRRVLADVSKPPEIGAIPDAWRNEVVRLVRAGDLRSLSRCVAEIRSANPDLASWLDLHAKSYDLAVLQDFARQLDGKGEP